MSNAGIINAATTTYITAAVSTDILSSKTDMLAGITEKPDIKIAIATLTITSLLTTHLVTILSVYFIQLLRLLMYYGYSTVLYVHRLQV